MAQRAIGGAGAAKLVRRLAEQVLAEHPDRAATVVERLDQTEAVSLLDRGSVADAATIIRRLSPQYSTAVLQGLGAERAAGVLGSLPVETAARLLRRIDEGLQSGILDRLRAGTARSIRAVLRFPEGSAGALMDPDVLALPQELSAREALQRVRKAAQNARYNLYVVDQNQHLVGALNLRELLIARGRFPLSDVMTRDPHRLPATADRATVLAHPGWKEVHALPVVDPGDAYLGAIRYRTLRELEEELLRPRSQDADSGAAFGEVIATGVRGLLDAIAGDSSSGHGGTTDG